MNTPLNFLDLLLALYLLIELPRRQLWRSLHPSGLPPAPRLQRYRKNMVHIALPLVALAASMWWGGHRLADLGLDLPSSGSGLWCLVVSALALLAMHFGGLLWERSLAPDKRAAQQVKMREQLKSNDSLPRSADELRAFVLLSLFVGCGWELLYRGFLLLVLPPLTGVAGAVILSAAAYGAAHGYDSIKQFTASVLSAFLFTIAYALTHSLWWLMLIHTALGLFGALASYRAST
jgi:membrane protease YdiL (CAAX protease family)